MSHVSWRGRGWSDRQVSRLDPLIAYLGGTRAALERLSVLRRPINRYHLWRWRLGRRPMAPEVARRVIALLDEMIADQAAYRRELEASLPELERRYRAGLSALYERREGGEAEAYLPGDPRSRSW